MIALLRSKLTRKLMAIGLVACFLTCEVFAIPGTKNVEIKGKTKLLKSPTEMIAIPGVKRESVVWQAREAVATCIAATERWHVSLVEPIHGSVLQMSPSLCNVFYVFVSSLAP